MACKVARERTVTGSMPGGAGVERTKRRGNVSVDKVFVGLRMITHSIRLVHCLSPSRQTPSESQATNIGQIDPHVRSASMVLRNFFCGICKSHGRTQRFHLILEYS